MAELVLFHHAQGLTPGVHEVADRFRAAGHTVHVPDLYDGRTFTTIDDGVAHAESIGFGTIVERGGAAVADLPARLVYGGFSLGALPAQQLAQCRPGAAGALLFHGGVPVDTFGAPWPPGVPLQVHLMTGDEWSEPDVARELCDGITDGELFLYEGSAHLFADSSLPDHDESAAALLIERSLQLLDRVG